MKKSKNWFERNSQESSRGSGQGAGSAREERYYSVSLPDIPDQCFVRLEDNDTVLGLWRAVQELDEHDLPKARLYARLVKEDGEKTWMFDVVTSEEDIPEDRGLLTSPFGHILDEYEVPYIALYTFFYVSLSTYLHQWELLNA